jgi:N utilization substance protein A
MGEKIVEKLIEAGVGTVEKLGSMTPEELEAIPGIGPKMIEKILLAVNAYYSQFETPVEGAESPASDESLADFVGDAGESSEIDLSSSEAARSNGQADALEGEENSAEQPENKMESDTIKNSEEAG